MVTKKINKSSSQIMKKQALRFFLISFSTGVLLFTLAMKVGLYIDAKDDLNLLKISHAAKVENARIVLDGRFERVVSDVRTIANTPSIQFLVAENKEIQRDHVRHLFLAFSREQKIFDDIRFLDKKGKEVVRVDTSNGKSYIVPDDQLQDKSGSYYFKRAAHLKQNDIFISRIDLNVEHNKIQIPYDPVIRFAMPLFTKTGEMNGILVVNLFGNMMLDRFRQMMNTQTNSQTMLLDQDGNWLVAPDPKLEWGFMFGHPAGFAKKYPSLWYQMSHQQTGHYTTNEGLYIYTTIYPLNWVEASSQNHTLTIPASQNNLKNRDYFWKIISFIPQQELPSANITRNTSTFLLYVGGLLLLLLAAGYLSYIAAARQKLRREISLQNRRHKQILKNLGEGVIVMDKQGIVTETNPEAAKLLGLKKAEILGHDAHSLFHSNPANQDKDSAISCPINSVAFTGQAYRNEHEVFYRKDKSPLPVSVVATPLTSDDQETIGAVLSFRDMTSIKAYQEKIKQLAYYDTLTGLPNRRLLNKYAELALGLAQRNEHQFAMMFIDLDKFKVVNDTYGHDAGDELLKWVAKKLTKSIRDTDHVARQSGDEFIVLLSEFKAADNINIVAHKILTQITKETAEIFGHLLTVNISIGIAVFPDHGTTVDELMQAADKAMYLSKRTGSSYYCIAGMQPETL
ncbi:diguanylate cyclase domain-containing protein [Acinetobacter sp. ANC 5502]